MSKAFGDAFSKLDEFLNQAGVQPSGPPRAIYTAYTGEETEFTVAIPIQSGGEGGAADGSVVVGELPGGDALRFVHEGPYEDLSTTYDKITEWMKAEGMLATEADWESHGPVWEVYLNDPATTPSEKLLTHIFVPKA